jgi:hypothetical protein
MPYMQRPDTEIPMYYGVRLVVAGELVMVSDDDAAALVQEGWTIETPDASDTLPPIADKDK